MANKKVKRDYFMEIREIVKENADLVAFVDHELDLLARKNTGNSQTKTQKENLVIAEMLLEELAKVGKAITITDLMSASEVIQNYVLENGNKLTNQKISAIFTRQVKAGKIIRTIDKKKSYFSIPK